MKAEFVAEINQIKCAYRQKNSMQKVCKKCSSSKQMCKKCSKCTLCILMRTFEKVCTSLPTYDVRWANILQQASACDNQTTPTTRRIRFATLLRQLADAYPAEKALFMRKADFIFARLHHKPLQPAFGGASQRVVLQLIAVFATR